MLARRIARPAHEQRVRARQRVKRYARIQMMQEVIAVVVRMKNLAEHALERMIAAEADQGSRLKADVVGDLA